MRLLFVMHDRPNYPGGPIVNYMRLLPNLLSLGYDVHVLVFYWEDYPNGRALERVGVKVKTTKFYPHTIDNCKWIIDKAIVIKPDVFIPDVSTPGCFAAAWLKNFGIPSVNSHRSDDALNWGRAIFFSQPQGRFTTTALFFVSNYLKNAFQKRINNPELITRVIPSGVILSPYISDQVKDRLNIVYAGRLVQPQKNILEIINVFVALCKSYADIHCTIIGDGPEKNSCEIAVKNAELSDRILFTGKLDGDSYKKELSKNDVILLLSDYEGVPGSLMDGMSCGLIPVCFNYPGASELVDDQINGYLVKDKYLEVIKTIQRIKNDYTLRLEMSLKARKKIESSFSIEYALTQWVSLFKELQQKFHIKQEIRPLGNLVLPKEEPSLLEFNPIPRQTLRDRLRIIPRLKSILRKF